MQNGFLIRSGCLKNKFKKSMMADSRHFENRYRHISATF